MFLVVAMVTTIPVVCSNVSSLGYVYSRKCFHDNQHTLSTEFLLSVMHLASLKYFNFSDFLKRGFSYTLTLTNLKLSRGNICFILINFASSH